MYHCGFRLVLVFFSVFRITFCKLIKIKESMTSQNPNEDYDNMHAVLYIFENLLNPAGVLSDGSLSD